MIVDCQPCNFTADRNSVPGKLVSFGFMVYWLMASPKSSCEGFSSGGSKNCCSCVVANGMAQQQPEMLLLCSLPLAAAANSSADLVTSKSYSTIISERVQIFLDESMILDPLHRIPSILLLECFAVWISPIIRARCRRTQPAFPAIALGEANKKKTRAKWLGSRHLLVNEQRAPCVRVSSLFKATLFKKEGTPCQWTE